MKKWCGAVAGAFAATLLLTAVQTASAKEADFQKQAFDFGASKMITNWASPAGAIRSWYAVLQDRPWEKLAQVQQPASNNENGNGQNGEQDEQDDNGLRGEHGRGNGNGNGNGHNKPGKPEKPDKPEKPEKPGKPPVDAGYIEITQQAIQQLQALKMNTQQGLMAIVTDFNQATTTHQKSLLYKSGTDRYQEAVNMYHTIIQETTQKLEAGGYSTAIIDQFNAEFSNSIAFGRNLLDNIVKK